MANVNDDITHESRIKHEPTLILDVEIFHVMFVLTKSANSTIPSNLGQMLMFKKSGLICPFSMLALKIKQSVFGFNLL